MKSPIIYYGGKISMVKTLLPLFPNEYKIYTEAFFGGGAMLFAKKPSETEIINDTNGFVTNFFSVLKTDGDGYTEDQKKEFNYATILFSHEY